MKRKVTMGAAAAGLALGLAIPLIGQRGDGDSASRPADTAPAAAAPAARTGTASAQQDFRWAGRIARGDEIKVKGIVGNIRAELTSGDEVVVTAANPGRIPIRVYETEDGVTVCAAYHEDERYQRRRDRDDDDRDEGRREGESRRHHHDDDACGMGDGHGIHIDIDDEVDVEVDLERVDFVVRVPAGVRFSGATVEGDVVAEGLRSSVSAASVSGNVRVTTSEDATAATVSGDVDVTLGRMPADADLSFVTVSGNVDVRFPAGADADVKAHTLSGEIEADFPLETGPMVKAGGEDAPFNIDVQIGKRAEGRIGRGGANVELTTISGDIRVKRGS